MDSGDPPHRAGLRPADISSALGWWREAGVDFDYTDAPIAWLSAATDDSAPLPAAPRARAEPEAPADLPTVPFGGNRDGWPGSLADFPAWWLTEPTLDEGQAGQRVPPRGAAGAALMVIVPQPEAEDAGHLLGGAEGRLLEAMFAAMGLDATRVYVASALPRHTPLADWSGLAARGAGAVLSHHIGLVAPERLLVFGSTILPLLGHDPTHSAQTLRAFNHEGRSVPLLAARDLGALLARPAWKSGFWRTWLDWTGQERT